ncbi:MAG TPA: DNA topoisomerase IB [Burkholderiales bacterium]|nr:DNA topoisomerase IB [Burkholderiales bacterium]
MSDAAALHAGALHFSSDRQPGIRRCARDAGFVYVLPNGRQVKNEQTLARIRKLAIPPAYRDVWICLSPDGHLQATGYDARGRKQYRYHPRWREVRDEDKFRRMLAFGRALPRIHRKVALDMRRPDMPREKVLATLVRLLETTLIRVGNEQYVRENRSYGLTTLRNRHVAVSRNAVHFGFRGKHGIHHRVTVEDPRVVAVVRRFRDLPGQELFEYVDGDGKRRVVTSSDVNEYLRDAAGEEFTAKDFRTWYATLRALAHLTGRTFANVREAKAHVKDMLGEVASKLGNTPAMCRKCYVHPIVIESFLAGTLAQNGSAIRRNERAQLLQLLRRASTARVAPRARKVRSHARGQRARDPAYASAFMSKGTAL